MAIENTSDPRNRDLHALGLLAMGTEDYITGMEAAGQAQIVRSDRMPTSRQGAAKEWAELGFTFGDPDPADPLFCPATLPDGWTREGSDHNMWSSICDQRGLRRVAVFYKAAFYDRDAAAHIIDVGADAARQAIYGDGPIDIPWHLFTEDEIAAAGAAAVQYIVDSSDFVRDFGPNSGREARMARAQTVVDSIPESTP